MSVQPRPARGDDGRLAIPFRAKLGAERFRQRLVAGYRAFAGSDRVGSAGPPSEQRKRWRLLQLFQSAGHSTFIESGTFLGDTVAFFLTHADRIISVEIDPDLQCAAAQRFKPYPHVDIILGDALERLPAILGELNDSCLVWLDGHFSRGITGRGTHVEPAAHILDSLSAVSTSHDITVVVDDLRLFGLHPEFPTLDELLASARHAFPDATIWAELDGLIIQRSGMGASAR